MVKGKNFYLFNLFRSENVILAYLAACIIIILMDSVWMTCNKELKYELTHNI